MDVPSETDPEPVTLVVGAPRPATSAHVVLATRVVDEDGRPIAGVPFGVGLADGARFGGVVRAGADGTLDVACAGRPQFVATYLEGDLASRYLYTFVWLRPGATRAQLVLRRAEPIAGTVVGVDRTPLSGAWVVARVGARRPVNAVRNQLQGCPCSVTIRCFSSFTVPLASGLRFTVPS